MLILTGTEPYHYTTLELCIGLLILFAIQLIFLYYLRNMVYRSAFEGISRSGKKKILENKSWGQKITLLFTKDYGNRKSTKIRLGLYYFMLAFCFVLGLLCVLRQYFPQIRDAVYRIGGVWLGINVLFMLMDVSESRRERRDKD